MMTTYNRADLIDQAIDSVLRQSYQNWELIILDDASKDNTSEVILKYTEKDNRTSYYPAPQNLGINKNRNRGFQYAQGKYIAVLDSDDYWLSNKKLSAQVDFLEENPEHALVGTNVSVIQDNNPNVSNFIYSPTDEDIRKNILLRNQFTHSAMMWRKDAVSIDKVYDESLPIWEDYELILRLGLTGKISNLPEVMTAYRKHSGNISKTAKRRGAKTHLDIINKYRQDYPNYPVALIKGYLRFIV